jgi:site-specific recombinase XerD
MSENERSTYSGLRLIPAALAMLDVPMQLAHPHALRHGYALSYLAGGGTLGRLQQLFGHEDIATTERYLAALDEQTAPSPKDPRARS